MCAEKTPLVIFGTGEISSLAKFYFERDSGYEVHGFTADDAYVTAEEFAGKPLVPFSRVRERFPAGAYEMFVALSYRGLNQVRRERYLMVKEAGYRCATYISSRSVVWQPEAIGENCLILENQTIQPGVRIGSNVTLWSGNHIGHGTVIGDHTYISSHVVISGHVTIGQSCFFGVNAAVRDYVTIEDDCFVTMGAVVTQHVRRGSVATGARGDVLSRAASRMLINRYFGPEAKLPDAIHSAV
jgi:sugar O-acyltransferase (sialic acid O-acetyltransferase NeuD family)